MLAPGFLYSNGIETFESALQATHCSNCRSLTHVWPVCAACAPKTFGIRIGQSTLHGYGLFATRNFSKNECIVPILGELVSGQDLDKRYGPAFTAPYAIDGPEGKFYDGSRVRYLGHFCNSIAGPSGRSILGSTNAHFQKNKHGEPCIIATKAISAGQEIVAHYGRQYRFYEAGVRSATHWPEEYKAMFIQTQ